MTYSDRVRLISSEQLSVLSEDSIERGYWSRAVVELDELATRSDIPMRLPIDPQLPEIIRGHVELVNSKWELQNS